MKLRTVFMLIIGSIASHDPMGHELHMDVEERPVVFRALDQKVLLHLHSFFYNEVLVCSCTTSGWLDFIVTTEIQTC